MLMFLILPLYIWVSSATCTQCLQLELVSLVFLVLLELLRVQMFLWSIDPEILHVRVPRSQGASRILKSWHDQIPKNLYDHGCIRTPGCPASSGCCVVGCRPSTQNLLRAMAKAGKHRFILISQRGMSLIPALRTQNMVGLWVLGQLVIQRETS